MYNLGLTDSISLCSSSSFFLRMVASQYTPAEGRARDEIDRKLAAAGWVVQTRPRMNLYEGIGHAIREFPLRAGHGRVDYLLFVDQMPIGSIEAKPDGTTLIEVELQSMLYTTGLPDQYASRFERLPFAFESTGTETRWVHLWRTIECSQARWLQIPRSALE